MTNALRVIAALLVSTSAAYLVAVRRDLIPVNRASFATLVALSAVSASVVAVHAALRAATRPRRLSALAEALAAAGLVAVAVAGCAGWAFRIRGVVVVPEREPIRLSRPEDVNAVDAGPLANLRDLDVTVGLARLKLVGAGPGHFRAVSFLKVLSGEGEEVGLRVAAGEPARFRTLVFKQGAFGFLPHIVIEKSGHVLLDTSVPFRTLRDAEPGLAFLGDFTVREEDLAVHGAVTLADLNDEMNGHPTLELVIERSGKPLGSGNLKPGEFVDLPEGFRVGFTGLRRWSEIDFATRTWAYRAMYAGFGVFLVGVLLWPVAFWRKW